MLYDLECPLGQAQANLKVALVMTLTMNLAMEGGQLTREHQAEVLNDILGDIVASLAGSSAVALGKLSAEQKAALDANALHTFNRLSELGIN